MTKWKLESLLVENFRSISGRWTIPMDADIILVHGPNGAGKTSLLSALELGATGNVGYLESADADPQLVNRNFPLGRVELGLRAGRATRVGQIQFAPGGKSGEGALLGRERIDFLERCFLPQTVLGRLLESYATQDQADSALVRFVKDLAGIDDLDSLIDGLHAAGHLARTRALSGTWSKLEDSIQVAHAEVTKAERDLAEYRNRVASTSRLLREIVPEIADDDSGVEALIASARDLLRDSDDASAELATLESQKVRLDGILLTLSRLDASSDGLDNAEAVHAVGARQAFEQWEQSAGLKALLTLNRVRARLGQPETHQSLLFESLDETKRLVQARAAQEREAQEGLEKERLAFETRAAERAALTAEIERVEGARANLAVASDVRLLIDALASALPLVHDDSCPICDQNFPGGSAALAEHIDRKIVGLSDVAERYRELSSALDIARVRIQELNDFVEPPAPISTPDTPSPAAEFIRDLNSIESEVERGVGLRRSMETSQVRLAEISALQSTINAAEEGLGLLLSEAEIARGEGGVLDVAKAFEVELSRRQQLAQFRVTLADRVRSALELIDENQRHIAEISQRLGELKESLRSQRARLAAGKKRKDAANQLRLEAERVRSALISQVFDHALNQSWASFFSRLVPSEPFVPQFRQHVEDSRAIDVRLETVDADGNRFGSPSSMLSFGNANTAALSLFLALHVSAPTEIDWLVFDDPVQSMDDIHVANFAAVVRQLTVNHDRQVVIAVHQRELFDYLAFELSPASASDQMLKIELERRGEVSQVRWERVHFESEGAIFSV